MNKSTLNKLNYLLENFNDSLKRIVKYQLPQSSFTIVLFNRIVLFVCSILAPAHYFKNIWLTPYLIFTLGLVCLCFEVFKNYFKKIYFVQSVVLISASLATVYITSFFSGGLNAPAIAWFLPIVAISLIVLGKRACIAIIAMIIFLMSSLFLLESLTLLPKSIMNQDMIEYLRPFSFSLSLITTFFLIIIIFNWYEKSIIDLKYATESKRNFFNNISHEMRTPLNAILGNLNFLEQKEFSNENKLKIDTIKLSTKILHEQINNILDLNLIEQGKIKLRSESFSIFETAEELAKLFINHHDSKIDFNYQFTGNNFNVIGDELKLKQILLHLINNSFRFTSEGKIEFKINSKKINTQIVCIEFEVSDTGSGIDENILNEFELTNFNSSFKDNEFENFSKNIIGMGLHYSNKVLKMMDSKLNISSSKESGSNFNFKLLLPLNLKKQETNLKQDEIKESLTNLLLNDKTILIVEDNLMNAKLLNAYLLKTKAKILHAKNGIEAINLASNNNIDLIFMDIQMPEMNGYSATRIIRQNLKFENPIIALTAFNIETEKKKCFEAGMNAFMSKPFLESDLVKNLNNFFNLKKI